MAISLPRTGTGFLVLEIGEGPYDQSSSYHTSSEHPFSLPVINITFILKGVSDLSVITAVDASREWLTNRVAVYFNFL